MLVLSQYQPKSSYYYSSSYYYFSVRPPISRISTKFGDMVPIGTLTIFTNCWSNLAQIGQLMPKNMLNEQN